MKTSKFILFSSLICLLLIGIAFLLQATKAYPIMATIPAILVSYLTTIVAYTLTAPTIEKKFNIFLYAVLGSMMGKMMIGILTVVVVALFYKEWKTIYVVSYFFSYFLYTFFEVYALMRNLRPFSKEGVEK